MSAGPLGRRGPSAPTPPPSLPCCADMSAEGQPDAEHPRFFVGCDDGEGDELLDPGRIMGYDCLYENVEEEEEGDEDEEYDSVSFRGCFGLGLLWLR